MILVTTGASLFRFDRLLLALDGLAAPDALVVQHGPSPVRPAGAHCVAYLPLEELAALVREARLVITHAGAGSILLALTNGRRPIVVPRLHAYGETVDDHQVECARRFARANLVTAVEDLRLLPAALAAMQPAPAATRATELPLVRELRAYVAEAVQS
jgi:UDP-N-acetylglucosamine transferase subunit ALG13